MSGLKRRFTPYTVEDKIPTNFQSFQVYFAYPAMLVIWIVALVWMPEKLNGSVMGPLIDMALCILVLCWLKNWKMPGYYAVLLLQIWNLVCLPFSVRQDIAMGKSPGAVTYNALVVLVFSLGIMLYYWKRKILFVLSKEGGKEALLVIRRAAAAPGGKTLVEAGILQVIGGGETALEKDAPQEEPPREADAPDGCDAAGDGGAGEGVDAGEAQDIRDGGEGRSDPS